MSSKRKMNNKKFAAVWGGILAVVLVIAVTVNILCATLFYGVLTTFFDGGEKVVQGSGETYYHPTAENHDAAIQNSQELIKAIQGEGTILLKNDGFLPMDGTERVTLFGRDSVDFMYGGGGSGSLSSRVSRAVLKDTLETAGFTVNPVMWELLSGLTEKYPRGKSAVGQLLAVGEIPVSEYTADVRASYSQYSDAAIVVIGRSGSEGTDLDPGGADRPHALELGQDELDVLEEACSNFENVVVILNTSATLELGFLEEYPQIRAALYVGFTGDTGLEVIGDILKGAINPSGHTVDTFAYDLTTAPSFVNMTSTGFGYSNLADHWFIEYEEGIYVGYRWYETADAEGFWSSQYAMDTWGVSGYEDVVQFPFGYGLSYTSFDWAVTDWTVDPQRGGQGSVTVAVTNTGSHPGKDVVQLYFTAPYDPAEGIEKSSVVLLGYAKTGLLAPGETGEVTISFALEDMASYDYRTERAYVLSAGEYTLSLRTDAHTVKAADNAQHSFALAEKLVFDAENGRESDLQPAVNRFDDVSAHIERYLSRSDFAGTMPTAPTAEDMTASPEIIEGVKAFVYDTYAGASMPATSAAGDTVLVDLVGKDYDDPLWDALLDRLTLSQMDNLVSIGGYKTVGASSIGKPPTVDPDGPGGFAAFFTTSIYGAGFCSEVVLASTWNDELALEMGRAIGEEGLQGGYSGWYAPAVNIHRSPFGGRNFEYYSEDGLLSGKMAAAVIRGCGEKGVYCYVKHFAVNDQETKRSTNGLLTWCNEQAMRELYFKPFELAVKEGKTTAVMSSFNRLGTIWAGGHRGLLTEVLRNEWGFVGMVVTDYSEAGFTYMDPDQAISAGGDLQMETVGKHPSDTSSAPAVTAMRQACKNILYTIANSHAMNGATKGQAVVTETPSWVKVGIAVDVAVGIALLAGAALIVRRVTKNRDNTPK